MQLLIQRVPTFNTQRRHLHLHRLEFLRSDFKDLQESVPDLLGADSIDDGVDGGRQQDVHQTHEGVSVGGDVDAGRQEGDAAHQVEAGHHHQVRPAGVERLPALFSGRRRPQDDAQDLHVGEEDNRGVDAHETDDNGESGRSISLRVAAR
ncbi:hypothetical protein F7725_021299 [Dissostichus mawsoni]|uniref:Uncharacterized protein n=1 Tax=Dissostichus mawsoni TaxID=36200 RepID=A0A7J5YH37_DISMA|nr:hypothetical protein F7725_021299 [Dissostichus mawsoni]